MIFLPSLKHKFEMWVKKKEQILAFFVQSFKDFDPLKMLELLFSILYFHNIMSPSAKIHCEILTETKVMFTEIKTIISFCS